VSRHHPPHYHRFYRALGQRVKQLRKKKGYTQEDMISFGFGLRHWQQIEGGHPINIWTLLRICEAFDLRAWQIIRGLDDGFPRSQRRDHSAVILTRARAKN
jgi:transcriptional regulator with XRE-family HTH domain